MSTIAYMNAIVLQSKKGNMAKGRMTKGHVSRKDKYFHNQAHRDWYNGTPSRPISLEPMNRDQEHMRRERSSVLKLDGILPPLPSRHSTASGKRKEKRLQLGKGDEVCLCSRCVQMFWSLDHYLLRSTKTPVIEEAEFSRQGKTSYCSALGLPRD